MHFTNLNKACPKDYFHLPSIDRMVDASAGHQLLTFMDIFLRYNHIFMHTVDQDKTSFITEHDTYCYKVMSFGLKNVSTTYKRLMNKIFKEKIMKSIKLSDLTIS